MRVGEFGSGNEPSFASNFLTGAFVGEQNGRSSSKYFPVAYCGIDKRADEEPLGCKKTCLVLCPFSWEATAEQ